MEAMIFAAGLGTRLKPLTDNCPKALVGISGKTLLEHNIETLIKAGAEHIVINVHHFAPMMKEFINNLKYQGVRFTISDETDKLLDTGGGLKKAHTLFQSNKPVIVVNVDIISDIDLKQLYACHLSSGSIATLAVRNRQSSRYFLFNHAMQLAGWQNLKTNETVYSTQQTDGLKQLAFSGIQVVSHNFFNYFPDKDCFSVVEMYLALAGKQKVLGYNHDADFWFDIGSPEKLAVARQHFCK